MTHPAAGLHFGASTPNLAMRAACRASIAAR